MHAVAALCHFCENHGPRVVMTTQCVRDSSNGPPDSCPFPEPSLLPDSTGSYSELRADYMMDGYRCRVEEEVRCMACSSFVRPYGVCTTDSSAHISYVSSQMPLSDRVSQLLRHACLRSLSCEISGSKSPQTQRSPLKGLSRLPRSVAQDTRCRSLEDSFLEANTDSNDDGVVLFGDDASGYTLSHTFRLRDAKARGFQRWFSLILLSMDKYLITSNYDFFVTALSSIIQQLQEQASAVFRMERSELSNECFKQANASRSSMLPAHFLRTRLAKLDLDTSRSLTLITGCPSIFTKLHKQMTWLLRTQSRLCVESVLEGVPSQDALVELELQPTDVAELHLGSGCTDECPHSVQSIAALQCFAHRLRDLPSLPLLGALPPLDVLLTQLVLGSQIVIKCDDGPFAKQILLALSYLLPVGCIRILYASNYEHACKYNLFGCPRLTDTSFECGAVVISVDYVPSDSLPQSESASVSPPSSCRFGSPSMDDPDQHDDLLVMPECPNRSIVTKVRSDFENCTVVVEQLPRCIPTPPAIAIRYRELLLDGDLSWRVLHAVIRTTREQWLCKAKLIYQLSRQKERIDLTKVLHIVKCSTEDVAVLNFWQAGLSKIYKEQVLDAIRNDEKLCT